MYTLQHLSIALIASTVLIVAPVLGCCSGAPLPFDSDQSSRSPAVALSALENHLTASETQIPCHDMATTSKIDSAPQLLPVHDSEHCDTCENCVTSMTREASPALASFFLADTDFETLYFFVLLDFPAFQRKIFVTERPPDNSPMLALTPITLHQILTI